MKRRVLIKHQESGDMNMIREIKKLMGGILSAMLAVTIIMAGSVSIKPVEVKAATGTWTLIKTNYVVHDTYESGNSKVTFSYKGTENGKVYFINKGGRYEKGYNAYCDQYFDCTIPASQIDAGGTVSVTMHTKTDNIGADKGSYYLGDCHTEINKSNLSDFSGTAISKLYDSTNKYEFGFGGSTSAAVDESKIVSGSMPTSASDGDTVSVYFITDYTGRMCGFEWQYQYRTSSSSSDNKAVGQVKNVKVTNKAKKYIYISYSTLADADGYQIRYSTNKSMKSAKSMDTTSTKGYFKKNGKKVSFKNGKTYYVQVRAYAKDSSGSKVYGKWSAKKKIKIKK